jgi:2-dehydro-3-deoxygluconokinase
VICFGEMLIRLSPAGGRLLLQDSTLETFFGGAEANVAVSLARLGTRAAMASVLPENPFGRAALEALRGHGVDVGAIGFGPGRMGLYFVTPGAVLRPTEVVYDRAGSAFAAAAPDTIDWKRVLDGAAWLHLSGVTPALGERAAEAAARAVEAANRAGVKVSFDGNYRAKLWAAWDGDGPAILRNLLDGASLAFVDERDIALVLGQAFLEEDPAARRRAAAAAAFAAFPKLERIASTFRIQHGFDHYELSAVMFTREAELRTRAFSLPGVVDRIGAGDAFAAGVLHSLTAGLGEAEALDFGLAAACLKHGIAGDFNLARAEDVEAFLAGGGLDVRR